MIYQLDKSLENLLKRELWRDSPTSNKQLVSISFDAPDDQFPPSGTTPPAIDLFLYDIRINQELSSTDWVETGDWEPKRIPPPYRVDCSYLVTAWAGDGSETRALDEHLLLSEVVKVLLRYPVLPEKYLVSELRDSPYPLPITALQAGQLQSVGEFWQALGGKPKASLHYTVTLCVQPRMPEPVEGKPVVQRRLNVREMDVRNREERELETRDTIAKEVPPSKPEHLQESDRKRLVEIDGAKRKIDDQDIRTLQETDVGEAEEQENATPERTHRWWTWVNKPSQTDESTSQDDDAVKEEDHA